MPQPPQVGWLAIVIPAVSSILVMFLAYWLPRRDKARDELGASLAEAQENVFKVQREIIDGLRREVTQMQMRVARLEEQNRQLVFENEDCKRRVRELDQAVRALGGGG